ncbi:hypothetical protein U7230_15075 [Carboxydochorda subterranea]|uniref:Outer membrane lipoprotein-sorting protein n=1 Tax=Carboxydichorda subterranea TaxID=3109565 RepID=A0ABZ1BX70_9FIRM|nr:hypothetical protein [Limnochorda sp. L945t]WRP17382.1 hypothetical protein U7230_15075 [Limnochorda sp. L945t]
MSRYLSLTPLLRRSHTAHRDGALRRAAAALALALVASLVPQPTRVHAAETLTAQQILERSRQAAQSIQDLSARVTTVLVDAKGRRTRTVSDVYYLRTPGILRLEVVEPSALADQVYILDAEKKQMQVYLPVTNQVVVREFSPTTMASGANPSGQGAAAPLLESFLGALPQETPKGLKFAGTERSEGTTFYILEAPVDRAALQRAANPSGAPAAGPLEGLAPLSSDVESLKVWVDARTWLPSRVEALNQAGQAVSTITIAQLRVNSGLKIAALRQLPADAEVVPSR